MKEKLPDTVRRVGLPRKVKGSLKTKVKGPTEKNRQRQFAKNTKANPERHGIFKEKNKAKCKKNRETMKNRRAEDPE